jgi:hypothetical protein
MTTGSCRSGSTCNRLYAQGRDRLLDDVAGELVNGTLDLAQLQP